MIGKSLLFSLLLSVGGDNGNKDAIAESAPTTITTYLTHLNTQMVTREIFSDPLWIAADQPSDLSQILETIDKIKDTKAKIILLNNVAREYIQLGEIDKASEILEQSLSLTNQITDSSTQVNLLISIAEQYSQIDQIEKAKEILQQAQEIANTSKDKFTQGQLLLEIAFSYQKIGLDDQAKILSHQSQEIITVAAQPVPDFPFTATPQDLSLGIVGNVSSFRDTTAFGGVNVDYYKQGSLSDISMDGFFSLNFDSGRTVNNYRPSILSANRYRRHFNKKWSFYSDLFGASNQDLFSSRNDDEDLTVIVNGLVGASLNLWRGETPKQFLDVRFGLGGRYDYAFIAFEERRNQINPVIGFQIIGQDIQWGKLKITESLGIIPSLRDIGDVVISSTTDVSIPITEKWSYVNTLFIRYRSQTVFEENPNLEVFFTTGVDYKF